MGTESEDILVVMDTSRWERYPLLPVIHRRNPESHGFVIAGGGWRVYLGDVHLIKAGRLRDAMKDVEVFPSAMEMLRHWEVDHG